jgi:tetratricopeptide (TPR) repeat protein
MTGSSARLEMLSVALAAGIVLSGCAAPDASRTALPWQDAAYAHDPALVSVTRDSLFALDPELLRSLRARPEVANANRSARTAELLTLVFGPDLKAFAYAGGSSTVAADTWRNRRGDCLSLSVMSVALARALDVPAQVQEVRVPPLFDRRGGIDFLNQHVNVLVPNDRDLRVLNRVLPAGAVVIDFEPQPGTRSKGRALDDQQVLARYLNNLGAEHLAAGDERRAYAHFKAAIGADPAFASAYGNLAQLYLRARHEADAERLLRLALAHDGESDLAAAALHRLLVAQGRTDEALRYQTMLEDRRDRDPYHWLGLGLHRLEQQQPALAIDALERAQALASGFEEIHRALAVAYWQSGQLHRARDQLALLSVLGSGDAKLALLSRKLGSPPVEPPRPP